MQQVKDMTENKMSDSDQRSVELYSTYNENRRPAERFGIQVGELLFIECTDSYQIRKGNRYRRDHDLVDKYENQDKAVEEWLDTIS